MDETYIETVEFRAIAPANKSNLKGLDQALAKLNAINAAWQSLQARMSGMMQPVVFRKTAGDIKEAITNAERLGRFGVGAGGSFKPASLKTAAMATALGYDPKAVQNFLVQGLTGGKSQAAQAMRRQVREIYNAGTDEFRSVTAASKGIAMFTKHFDPKQDPWAAMQMMFREQTPVRAVTSAAAGAVPAPVKAPAAKAPQKVRALTSAATGAEEGGKAEAESKAQSKKFRDTLAAIRRNLAEDLKAAGPTGTADMTKVATARKQAAERVKALVAQSGKTAPGSGKKYDDAMAWAATQQRQSYEASQKGVLQSGAQLGKVRTALARAKETGDQQEEKLLRQQEAALNKSITNHERSMRQLDAAIYRPLEKQRETRRKQQQKEGEQESARLKGLENVRNVGQAWQSFLSGGGVATRDELRTGKGGARRELRGEMALPGGQMKVFNATIGERDATLRSYMKSVEGPRDRLDSAIEGLSPRNMAANILKVTEWAAAVGILYKSVELARYSLERLEQTGMEMAHLGIVFRGVGGGVQDLTNDIVQLAAAQGRETSEAMESAIMWARLGGDRKTINEEVRVSAEAANIANMHMTETTRQLMALMHIYHLEAADLNGVVGMLVNTSLKFNVTLEELFIGLDRSAAAAKIAGVNLAELQAMIGVVVGATGQTGSMTGNAIKYIFQELNKGDIQRQLRGYGIEPLTNNLNQKPAGQIFSELSGIYGTLDQRSQQRLSGLLGGRFNAARVPVLLENYPKVLNLAIDAQLNLNKAQEANVKILDTLKAQVAGLRAEWDKMLLNTGIMRFATTAVTAMKYGVESVSATSAKHGLTDEEIQKEKQKYFDQIIHGPRLNRNAAALGTLTATLARVTGVQTGLGLAADVMPGWLGGKKVDAAYRFFKTAPGLVDVWNMGHAPGQVSGQDGFEEHMQRLRGVSGANETRVRLFDLTAKMLKNGTLTAENANITADAMNGVGVNSGAFLKAFQGGNREDGLRYMNEAREKATREALRATQEAQAVMDKRNGELTQRRDELTTTIAGKVGKKQDYSQEQKELDGVNAALQKNTEDTNDNANAQAELAGELENVQIAQQRFISLLKLQEDAMEAINRIYTQVPAHTAFEALGQQAGALQDQLRMLEEQQKAFELSPDFKTAEGQQVDVEMTSRIKKVQAELDSVQNPMRQELAQRQTYFQYGTQRAERNAAGERYGVSEGEKLIRERAYLMRDIADTEKEINGEQLRGSDTTAARAQQLQDINLMERDTLDLLKRQEEVHRDIKQLAIDQNREFMRSFMSAGPGEMLQKLAAFRMSHNQDGSRRPTLSQGMFFAMAPEMRTNYGMLNPDYNPQMIEFKNELKHIHDAVTSIFGSDKPDTVNQGMMDIGKRLVAATAGLKDLFPSDMFKTAAKTVEESADRMGRALDHLADKINGVPGGGGSSTGSTNGLPPRNPQSGGVGGSRGFAPTNPDWWRGGAATVHH